MKHDKATMNAQRKVLALMGFLLPILAPLMGFIAYERNAPDFWHSISATFYATSNVLMIGCLAIFAFYLLLYKGYDIGDHATCAFSALMALGILIFPCNSMAAGDRTGVFNLPSQLSNMIHCIVAAFLFGSFAYMIGFRFTKSSTERKTIEKLKRNITYRICSIIIMLAMASQLVTSFLGLGWFTIINEAVMLWAFSFAWAVKADVFKKFRDN